MSGPDTDRERHTSTRYDEWPIERETAAVGDQEEPERDLHQEVEWLGTVGDFGNAYIYDPGRTSLYRGEIDDENERIVLREEGRRDIESEESLGERLEEIGEEHDWDWLSSFARNHLEDDESDEAGELVLRDTEFDERNVAADADHDVSFTGRHTFEDSSGRAHMQEHWFYARDEGDRVSVEVREDFLVAEAPRAEESSGDAEPVERREHEFGVELDTSGRGWESRLGEHLREWHEEHAGWPTDAAPGDETPSLSGR